MAMARLFSRSRPMYAPSCPTLKCNTYASSASLMKDLIDMKTDISRGFDEKIWNIRREESKVRAKTKGSPFTILEDNISTNNACYNSERKKLEEQLRGYKDINCFTEINSILRDKRLENFQSSMTADEIRNSVMRHLYVLTLQEVIPSEKLYLEDLINEDKHYLVEYRWRYRDYHNLFIIYSKRFGMLPERCLRRGVELHMSRIPHKYCLRRNLPKVLRKELLRKLEEDYEILTSKIHDLPTISEEMMASEIKSLVDHVPDANFSAEDPNSCYVHWWYHCSLLIELGRPWFH